jgi:hypothetical protein
MQRHSYSDGQGNRQNRNDDIGEEESNNGSLVFESRKHGAKADLLITDSPYNVAIDGHASGLGKVRHREFAMASGEMSSAELTEFLRKAMMLSRQSSQPGSLAYYFMDWRHMKQILAAVWKSMER